MTQTEVRHERTTQVGAHSGEWRRENTHTQSRRPAVIFFLNKGKLLPQSDVSRLNLCCSEETSGVLIVNGRGWVCGQK